MSQTSMMEDFLDYCYAWYGNGGLYDHGATKQQIADCVIRHISNPDRAADFQGDSLDREQVREWLASLFGLEEKVKGVEAQ